MFKSIHFLAPSSSDSNILLWKRFHIVVSLIVLCIKLITFRVKKIIMENEKISFVTFLSEAILTLKNVARMRDKLCE